jgi:hypothetical protein
MDKFKINIEQLIAEYLSGEISEARLIELEKLANIKGLDLKDFIKIHNELNQFDVPETSQKMDENFYRMLKEQKDLQLNESNPWLNAWSWFVELLAVPKVPRLAYGFILLLIGLIIGNMLMPNRGYEKQISGMHQEMSEMRKLMVLSMIEGKQATDRIRAVSFVNDMDKADYTVIDALFKTMNNDDNINVRLASLEALLKFTNLPTVRKQLVESLKFQESPIVLIELASTLIQIQEKNSIQELEKLLKKQDLDPNLRLTIEQGIKTLI